MQRLIPPDEKTLSLSFELTMPESRGTLNLAVPAVASNALLRKISAEAAYQSPRAAAGSREQLQKRLLDSPFELELSLGDIRVPLHDIAGLSPGDLLVLPRCLDSPAALLVAGIRMFSARAVRYGAMRAAQLVSREDSGSSERKEQPR